MFIFIINCYIILIVKVTYISSLEKSNSGEGLGEGGDLNPQLPAPLRVKPPPHDVHGKLGPKFGGHWPEDIGRVVAGGGHVSIGAPHQGKVGEALCEQGAGERCLQQQRHTPETQDSIDFYFLFY